MNWQKFFNNVKAKPYAQQLNRFLNEEYINHICYPPRELLFNAFDLTPLANVKVVIIGQDPYHQPGQAMGLAFSVPQGIMLPPSLRNIYREIEDDLGIKMSNNGDLTYLAKQGVLLLNARLSVRQGQPLSHDIDEYIQFINDVMAQLNQLHQPIVYLLWGGFARNFKKMITNPNHLVLESAHPSPLSANRGGFFGMHHFSQANHFLIINGLEPIDWQN